MRLMKPLLTLIAVCSLLSLPAFAQNCPEAGGLTFATSLFGSQFGGPGAQNGFGNGYITFNPAMNTATVSLNVAGIGGNITGAGLFTGTRGGTFSNATLPLTDQNNSFESDGTFSRTYTISPALMQQILANPGGYSFGVSTAEYPNGAISGSLVPMQTFAGTFSGTSVVGSNGTTGAGAQNGGGAFTAQITKDQSGNSVLNYSFVPTGIGSGFTGLTLSQGITGQNGSTFLTLANSGTLANGVYTGSVPLGSAQAQQLMMNPAGYYVTANTASNPNGAIRAQFGAAQNEQWLPIVGRTAGAAGTLWATDINLFNTSYMPATVVLQYVSSGQSNAGSTGALSAMNTAALTIAPRGTTFAAAVLDTLWQMNQGLGSLRIVSDQPVLATARIYNDQRASGRGTFGQLISSVTRCDATTNGAIPGVYGSMTSGSATALQRTNIGFFNPNSSTVTVKVNLTNGQGASAATATSITVQPYTVVQVPLSGTVGAGALFNPASDVNAGTLTFTASMPIIGYASIVDAGSGDTSFVLARADMPNGAQTSLNDVAGFMNTANYGEVQAGQLAVSRASAAVVKNFAQQMVTEHNASISQAQTLFSALGITSSNNGPTTQFLLQQNTQAMATLNAAGTGAAFDRAYMQSQVQMHQMVLANLDNLLIPSAANTFPSAQSNAQLLQFLQSQRAAVASHLALAQQILAGL